MKSRKYKLNLFIAIFILFIGVVIGGFIILKSRTASTEDTGTNQTGGLMNADTTKDTDKDGLLDWQEILFATDKNNPDTDGDGYLDGEEVLSGYDPLKPAPNDKLSGESRDVLKDKDNLTQYFAQQLANQMTSLNPDPNTESLLKVSAQDILDNLSSEDLTDLKSIGFNLIPEIIREENLKTIKTTQETVLDYLRELETALKKNEDIYEDLDTFQNALKTGDFSEVKQIAKAYEDNYQDIKALTVPSDFSSLHIELLNILALTQTSLENFSQLNNDPVKAYLGLEMYKQAHSLFKTSFSQKLVEQLALIYQ